MKKREFIWGHSLRKHSPSWWENLGRVYGDKAHDWKASFFFPEDLENIGYIS